MCKSRKLANRHEGFHHNIILNPRLWINKIDENAIEECNEENSAIDCDFEMNELERELDEMNFFIGSKFGGPPI